MLPVKTVSVVLQQAGAGAMLGDAQLATATQEIIADGRARNAIQVDDIRIPAVNSCFELLKISLLLTLG